MTPRHKIMRDILLSATQNCPEEFAAGPFETADQIEAAYGRLVEEDVHWDYESEFRQGEVGTDVPAPSSRHYESRSVAVKTCDGSWVGWTFWYGGGKHGQPGEIDWMSEAYDLTCTEEQKVVTVRKWSVVG